MRRYVKNLRQYITEALNRAEWLNYKNDTALNAPDPDDDLQNVAALVQRLLNVDDPASLLFTGDEISISQDYRYFVETIIPRAEVMDEGATNENGYVAYYTLYQSGDKFFVKFDIKDSYEYSYIFIREEDYDYFDKFDKPIVPQPEQAPETPQTPQEAAPAQPAGGGATLV
jgi:hypothetical protein